MEQAPPSRTALRPSPDVVSRRLGDVVVLVHLPSNRIHELNQTGARIWEMLGKGLDPAAIADRLSQEFQVEEAGAELSVKRLLQELQAEGLLE